MEELAGKVAFVTGGASGIGLGLVRRFAQEGMRVAIADIEPEALEKARQELAGSGADVIGVECDVSQRSSVEAAAAQTLEAFGKVHVLCNNAGVSPVGALDQSSEGDWQWGVGVNLMGVVHGIQAFIPGMKEHGEGGHVINTSSIAGLAPIPTLGIYAATKFAVVAISEVLLAELTGTDIGVSVLCPSFVKTRLSEGARNRPADLGATSEFPSYIADALDSGMDPAEVAARVVEAIHGNSLYVITHPESKLGLQMRMEAILKACDPS